MRKKKGFTLVELLVVMAIISILAAIAIPNVQKWIARGRATSAIAEIRLIETTITKLLADAGRSSIRDLVDDGLIMADVKLAFGHPVTATMNDFGPDEFAWLVDVYSDTTSALLRAGREVLNLNIAANPYAAYYRQDVVRQLGTSYMSELGTDPWGNEYRIYPGQWPKSNGTIPFRNYLPPAGNLLPGQAGTAKEDELSLGTNSAAVTNVALLDAEDLDLIGAPANTRMEQYIWSIGENLVSGQALFNGAGYLFTDGPANYEEQPPELMGGGDDINNWDGEQSFMRHYN
ncbi:MAG: prepilin-type N-terminal cleavage/methylation domain-containing protein [Candidatus Hydrogenedentes bacterium]|nr:prepilin-type N-terminal cleavage/methylation domain-containing protein [Candidatus Hydrogenedentota bacterium]